VITGLPLSGEELESLATRLKKLCGAGGAVKDGNIEIQGDHRDRLVAELVKMGYEAKRSGG
jgi:translation initiation factor 1